jgi:hypothetical protein
MNRLKFKLDLNSNEIANYKDFKILKGISFLYLVLGRNPASFPSPAQLTHTCPLSRVAQ